MLDLMCLYPTITQETLSFETPKDLLHYINEHASAVVSAEAVYMMPPKGHRTIHDDTLIVCDENDKPVELSASNFTDRTHYAVIVYYESLQQMVSGVNNTLNDAEDDQTSI